MKEIRVVQSLPKNLKLRLFFLSSFSFYSFFSIQTIELIAESRLYPDYGMDYWQSFVSSIAQQKQFVTVIHLFASRIAHNTTEDNVEMLHLACQRHFIKETKKRKKGKGRITSNKSKN